LKSADMVEQAAKLTWALKHGANLKDFQDLLADEQTAMGALFRGGKGKSEMQRIQRLARALTSPEPSPVKPAAAIDEVAKALAAAAAVAAAADRDDGARRSDRSPSKDSEARKKRKSGDQDLRRGGSTGVQDLSGNSPEARGTTRRRAPASPTSGSGRKAQRRLDNGPRDLGDEPDYTFQFTKADLLAVLPRMRVSILDLQRGMPLEKRTQIAKAVKNGMEADPALSHQIDFAKLIGDGAGFGTLGKALAEGARWTSYDREEGHTHESRIDNFTRSTSATLWREAVLQLEKDRELPSAQLIKLQTCVNEKYNARANDVAEALPEPGGVSQEVVEAAARQARQVSLIWRVLGVRIAKGSTAAEEAAGGDPGAGATFTNKSWSKLLHSFFSEHVLQVTQEDVADFVTVAKPAVSKVAAGPLATTPAEPAGAPSFGGARGAALVGATTAAGAAAGGGGGGAAAGATAPRSGGTRGPSTTPSTVCIPASAGIVGPALGSDKAWMRCRRCNVTGHMGPECPRAYMARFGEPAPGHDADGERALGGGAWNGTDLTPLGKRLWREYIAKHGIVASVHARHTVDFS